MNPLSISIQNHTDHEIFESDIKEHPLWEQCSLKILFSFETNMNAITEMTKTYLLHKRKLLENEYNEYNVIS